jgi:hypothetical protein
MSGFIPFSDEIQNLYNTNQQCSSLLCRVNNKIMGLYLLYDTNKFSREKNSVLCKHSRLWMVAYSRHYWETLNSFLLPSQTTMIMVLMFLNTFKNSFHLSDPF